MATLGHPGKYAYCVAENPETNPWPPFHESRVVGVNPDQSAVTVFACDAPHAIYTPGSAQRILSVLAHSLPTLGVNMFHCAGEMLLAISAKPAAELARAGYAREDLQRYFFEKARYHLGELRRLPEALAPHDQAGNYWGATLHRPDVEAMADDEMLPMVKRPQDIHILTTGGDAQWWCAFCPGWGDYGGPAVTRPVRIP